MNNLTDPADGYLNHAWPEGWSGHPNIARYERAACAAASLAMGIRNGEQLT